MVSWSRMGQGFGGSYPEPRGPVLSLRRIADHHRLGRSILPSVWIHAHPRFERSDTQNRADGSRTRRSSQREPAVSLRDKYQSHRRLAPVADLCVRCNMRTPPTTARLLAKLENGAESDAFEAAKLLSNAKGVKLIASLSRILRSGVRPYSREAAAYALSWHKDRKAAEPLLSCATDAREQDSVRGQ